jgi:hypothetical protein
MIVSYKLVFVVTNTQKTYTDIYILTDELSAKLLVQEK